MSRIKLLKATSSQLSKSNYNSSLPSTVGTPIPSDMEELFTLLSNFLEQDYQKSLFAEGKTKEEKNSPSKGIPSNSSPSSTTSTSDSLPPRSPAPSSSLASNIIANTNDELTASMNLMKKREEKLELEKQSYELKLMEQEEVLMKLLLNLEEKEKLLM